MPINWKLRDLLKERGGNNASEISRIVLDQTGYQLSTQAVCDLLRQPKMIRLETMQAICNSFYIRLSDFVEVLPSAVQKAKKKRSVETRRRRTDSGDQRARVPVATPVEKKVDFAAFYPDARKFSSNSTKGKESVEAGKGET
jgi:DNA-binding Xre family transcriptional regulator